MTFQFQTGAIRSLKQLVIRMPIGCFNSKLVRLEVEGAKTRNKMAQELFQFQTGSIKSRDD